MLKKGASGTLSMLLLGSMFYSATMLTLAANAHDIEVVLEALSPPRPPHHLSHGNSTVLNATVINRGNISENDVRLLLLINKTVVVDSSVANLSPSGFYASSYFWAPSDGVYNVTAYAVLKPEESNLTNNVVTTWIKVSPDEPPIPRFDWWPKPPVRSEFITFDASASYDPDWGNITRYVWNIDGEITIIGDDESITPTINHKYTTYGDKTVTLMLYDTEGKSNSISKSLIVYARPTASFTYSGGLYVDYPLIFNASASYDPDNDIGPTRGIANYTWDFGDGNLTITLEPVIIHAYAENATYTVKLNVTDGDHLNNSTSRRITIRSGIPTADFVITNPRPLPGPYYIDEALTFDASKSTANGGNIISYFWDFGDGTNSTGNIVNHLFSEADAYFVTLTVTDDKGLNDSETKIVKVGLRVYMKVEPTPISSNPGEYFNVSIIVTNVQDLHSVVFKLTWPGGGTRLLDILLDAEPGNFTEPEDWFDPEYAPVQGSVWINATRNVSGTGVNGNWTIATLFFRVRDGTGNHTLHFAEHSLRNSTWATIDHNATDGYFRTSWPVANFIPPDSPVLNKDATFDASHSYDPDGGSITNYFWIWNDTTTTGTTNPIAKHNYTYIPDSGYFNVTLIVTDDEGDSWKTTRQVRVVSSRGVAVINVSSPVNRTAGDIPIYVTVRNEGSETTETFNVTVYANSTAIGKQLVTLDPRNNMTKIFWWATMGFPKGNYTIWAYAEPVPGETNTADNYYIHGIIEVTLQGDVNRDGVVDMKDIGIVTRAFGSTLGDPKWNPDADLHLDEIIDMKDIGIATRNFGQS